MATPFYHGLFKKYLILFGSIFDNIYIERDDSDGNAQKTIRVPVSYGPSEWYLKKYYDNPSLTKEINRVLPRMAFDIQSVRYASERKLNTTNSVTKVNTGYSTTKTRIPQAVPYDVMIRLSVLAKNATDALRIVEQILPSFTPELTQTVDIVDEMGLNLNVPIVLMNVAMNDQYEGSMKDDDRVIIWDLDFILKVNFYGPVGTSGIIKELFINMFDMDDHELLSRIRGRPGLTINGDPASSEEDSVELSQIYADDNWGYLVQLLGGGSFGYKTETADGYVFTPASGGVAYVPPANQYTTITFVIEGGGTNIDPGVKGEMVIPFPCEIKGVTLIADGLGSIVVDIWKSSFADVDIDTPAAVDSIVGPYKPTLTNEVKYKDSSLIGWTTNIDSDDVLRFNVDSAADIARLTISLKVLKTN